VSIVQKRTDHTAHLKLNVNKIPASKGIESTVEEWIGSNGPDRSGLDRTGTQGSGGAGSE